MIVLVDDERIFLSERKDTKIFRNSSDALDWLGTVGSDDVLDELWLDHDLGEVETHKDTIMPFVLALEEKAYFNDAPQIGKVFIHTMNFTERKRIRQALEKFFKVEEVVTSDFLKVEENL